MDKGGLRAQGVECVCVQGLRLGLWAQVRLAGSGHMHLQRAQPIRARARSLPPAAHQCFFCLVIFCLPARPLDVLLGPCGPVRGTVLPRLLTVRTCITCKERTQAQVQACPDVT